MSRKDKRHIRGLQEKLKAVTGESNLTSTQQARLNAAAKRQLSTEHGSALPRGANRWFRWHERLRKRAVEYAGLSLADAAKQSGNSHHVAFKDVVKDFTNPPGQLEQESPVFVSQRSREIVTQCVLFNLPLPSEDELYSWVKHGMPKSLFQAEVGGEMKEIDPLIWMGMALQSPELKAMDDRLFSKMSRFYEPYVGQKRIYCRGIDTQQVRTDVLTSLSSVLPKDVFRREILASFHEYNGEGASVNIPGLMGYYSRETSFSGDVDLLLKARDVFLNVLLDGSSIDRLTAQESHDRLYVKTKGETQVGGRIHTSWKNTTDADYLQILADAEKGSYLSPYIPVELGNRTVASKHEVELTEDSIESMVATVDNIKAIKSKSRITFASYKAYQIWDLRWVYPLQDRLASLRPFVALKGHDKTFNLDQESEEYCHAHEIADFLSRPNVSGASWDFSAHDTHQQAALEFLFGQGVWEGEGVIPRIFPDISDEEWRWTYIRATKSPVYAEGGLVFPGAKSAHGLFSGEGFTNIGESVIGYIMTVYCYLRWLRNLGILDNATEEELTQVSEAVAHSSLILVMGDDTVGLMDHSDLTTRLENIFSQTYELPPGVPIEEFVSYYGDMGFVASTDARKISYFTTEDTTRMLDFTAHLCYYEWDMYSKKFEQILHGYYPVMRTLCSYFYAERVGSAEELIYAARHEGKRIKYDSLFHEGVHQHFALTGFSVLSNMWMNPTVIQEIGIYYALKNTWHCGALASLLYNPTSVKRMLRSIQLRESGLKNLAESRTFHIMVRAYSAICEEYTLGQMSDRPDLDVVTEWATKAYDIPLYEWVKGLPGPASWNWESICSAAVNHIKNRSSQRTTRRENEMESVADLIKDAGFHGSIVQSLINSLPMGSMEV